MTLLTLLKKGCTITFPSGYTFKGDPSMMRIMLSYDTGAGKFYDGSRVLNKECLKDALEDEKKFAKENK